MGAMGLASRLGPPPFRPNGTAARRGCARAKTIRAPSRAASCLRSAPRRDRRFPFSVPWPRRTSRACAGGWRTPKAPCARRTRRTPPRRRSPRAGGTRTGAPAFFVFRFSSSPRFPRRASPSVPPFAPVPKTRTSHPLARPFATTWRFPVKAVSSPSRRTARPPRRAAPASPRPSRGPRGRRRDSRARARAPGPRARSGGTARCPPPPSPRTRSGTRSSPRSPADRRSSRPRSTRPRRTCRRPRKARGRNRQRTTTTTTRRSPPPTARAPGGRAGSAPRATRRGACRSRGSSITFRARRGTTRAFRAGA